jgi:FMS-like tyrosine kinase 1
VAVKTVEKHADYAMFKALESELKIMIHLGKHLNIVNLLGAVTKNVANRELFVIVEFYCFENLQDYLGSSQNRSVGLLKLPTACTSCQKRHREDL